MLAQPRFFIDGNALAWKGCRFWMVGGQGTEDAFGGFAGAAIRGSVDANGVGGFEEGAEAASCLFGLL